jgi:hypothetical protein
MFMASKPPTQPPSQVRLAGQVSRLTRQIGLVLFLCAFFAASPGVHATLKVVPGGSKGSAGAADTSGPPAKDPPARETGGRDGGVKDGAGKDNGARDAAPRDGAAKDGSAKEPTAKQPVAREPAPKDPPREHVRHPAPKEHSGKDAGGREAATSPRVRPADPARVGCSDELVALSLGTMGPEDIERLRSKGCLPAGAGPR